MSKKYVLKKDLKYIKAGIWFYENEHGDLVSPFGYPKAEIAKDVFEAFPGLLEDYFEEIPEKPKSLDDLKDGDEWFFINYSNDECYISCTTSISCLPVFRKLGWAFLTREEGEKELAYLKAREILKQDTKGFKPDWSDYAQSKYGVYYNHSTSYLDYSCYGYHQRAGILFATEADAEASIKEHKAEWLAYFGINKDGENGIAALDC